MTRVKAFINTYQIENFKIFTSNALVFQIFALRDIVFVPYSKRGQKVKITNALNDIAIDAHEIFIDCFPLGILGELEGLYTRGIPVHYISRRLRWDRYYPLIGNTEISIQCTYTLEPLEQPHWEFVHKRSTIMKEIELQYPAPNLSAVQKIAGTMPTPIWLVVHAFDPQEVIELTAYAEEAASIEGRKPNFIVLSDQKASASSRWTMLRYSPAVDWFPFAERIFSACGFNTMMQMLPYKEKHVAVPFPRKYDDQFWRYAYHNVQRSS